MPILLLAVGSCGGPPPAPPSNIEVLAEGRTVPTSIAVDPTSVYWIDHGNAFPAAGSVLAMPKAGGAVRVLVAAERGNLGHVAVDATHAFWINDTMGLMRVPLAGGTGVVVTTLGGSAGGLVLDDTYAYLVTPVVGGAQVIRVRKDGSAWDLLGSVSMTGPPGGLVADVTTLFFSTLGADGRAYSMPIGGGVATELVAGLDTPRWLALATDSTYVYAGTAREIVRLPSTGGPPTILASGAEADAVRGLAVDASQLYWGNGGGTLLRLALAGGTPAVVATADVGDLAQDATHVYFTDPTAGRVARVAKP